MTKPPSLLSRQDASLKRAQAVGFCSFCEGTERVKPAPVDNAWKMPSEIRVRDSAE